MIDDQKLSRSAIDALNVIANGVASDLTSKTFSWTLTGPQLHAIDILLAEVGLIGETGNVQCIYDRLVIFKLLLPDSPCYQLKWHDPPVSGFSVSNILLAKLKLCVAMGHTIGDIYPADADSAR